MHKLQTWNKRGKTPCEIAWSLTGKRKTISSIWGTHLNREWVQDKEQ